MIVAIYWICFKLLLKGKTAFMQGIYRHIHFLIYFNKPGSINCWLNKCISHVIDHMFSAMIIPLLILIHSCCSRQWFQFSYLFQVWDSSPSCILCKSCVFESNFFMRNWILQAQLQQTDALSFKKWNSCAKFALQIYFI